MEKAKKFFKMLLIFLGILLIIIATIFVTNIVRDSRGDISRPVGMSMNQIHELYTQELMYDKISENEEPHKILGDKVKIGKDVVTYSYSGLLQVGVNMDDVNIERDGKNITVTFPNWIGINSIDDVHYYKVSQKTLNQEKISNYNQELLDKDRAKIQQEAIDAGILENARESLEQEILYYFSEIVDMVYNESSDDYYDTMYDTSDFSIRVVIADMDKVEWKER